MIAFLNDLLVDNIHILRDNEIEFISTNYEYLEGCRKCVRMYDRVDPYFAS
jgi:hypothetical protein